VLKKCLIIEINNMVFDPLFCADAKFFWNYFFFYLWGFS